MRALTDRDSKLPRTNRQDRDVNRLEIEIERLAGGLLVLASRREESALHHHRV